MTQIDDPDFVDGLQREVQKHQILEVQSLIVIKEFARGRNFFSQTTLLLEQLHNYYHYS